MPLTHRKLPKHYENHPPASLTTRPLMMIANHARQCNDFATFSSESFMVKWILTLFSLLIVSFFIFTYLWLPEQRSNSVFSAFLIVSGPMYAYFFFDSVFRAPHDIAQRELKTQVDLMWAVSRKWTPLKSLWLTTGLSLAFQSELLNVAGSFTHSTVLFILAGLLLWLFAAMPIFGFSYIESKAQLYTGESSIEKRT